MSQIINNSDETELFDRRGRKQRKHLMLSTELLGVLALTQDDGDTSKFIERAVWHRLVDVYGIEEVQQAIEEVQHGIGTDDRLDQPKTYTIEV